MRRVLIAALLVLLPALAGAQSQPAWTYNPSGAGLWTAPLTPFAFRAPVTFTDTVTLPSLAGATFTGAVLLPSGTSGAKSLAFSNSLDTGIYSASQHYMTIASVNGGITINAGDTIILWSGGATRPLASDGHDFGTSAYLFKNLFLSRAIEGSKSLALTDGAAATSFVRVAVPTNGWAGGELIWTATSVSGSDQLVANGRVRFWGTDTAGTPVCGINKIGTDGEGHSGGANTLVCTLTNVVSTTNCAVSVTCTNDLAAAQAITFYGRVDMPTANTLTFP